VAQSEEPRAERISHLRWVAIADMKVSPVAQREFRPQHTEALAADFDLEAIGFPVVSHRGGSYYILDGQHRIAALKLIGYGDQKVQCECYEGLTEEDEARLFLRRSKVKAIPLIEKYKIGLTARLDRECDMDRTLKTNGFTVSQNHGDHTISCVGSLYKIYDRAGAGTMAWSVRVAYNAFGEDGLEGRLLEGLALIRQRYNGQLPEEQAVTNRLASRSGPLGIYQKANTLKRQTGNTQTQCIAGAIVEMLNGGRGGFKIPDWWKS
jgi:Family of unknown function (DUF6551)